MKGVRTRREAGESKTQDKGPTRLMHCPVAALPHCRACCGAVRAAGRGEQQDVLRGQRWARGRAQLHVLRPVTQSASCEVITERGNVFDSVFDSVRFASVGPRYVRRSEANGIDLAKQTASN